jgi:short-subunit dehydrogenase
LNFKKKYGPWAIVVGAAEGLGEAYSIALAQRKLNLVMVDVQLSAMKKLALELEIEYGIETKQIHLDLSEKGAANEIMKASKEAESGLLVYNAAFSIIRPFVEHTSSELDTFIEVNTRTQIQLIHAFSERLIDQNRAGGIIMMSSLAGLIGMQLVSAYAATKAFTWNLAEAIHQELKPYRIDVMACIAGATTTPAYLKTDPKYGMIKPAVMKPGEVAEAALKKLGKNTLFIPGFSNRFNYFILTRLVPRRVASKLANHTMGKMYSAKFDKN